LLKTDANASVFLLSIIKNKKIQTNIKIYRSIFIEDWKRLVVVL